MEFYIFMIMGLVGGTATALGLIGEKLKQEKLIPILKANPNGCPLCEYCKRDVIEYCIQVLEFSYKQDSNSTCVSCGRPSKFEFYQEQNQLALKGSEVE